MDGGPRVPEQRRSGSAAIAEPVALRFSVLGPVGAWRGAATAAELIDALWGAEPPSQALAALRTYASRLRKVLDPGVLASESGGYAVRSLGEGALDLAVAQDLATEAEKARSAGDLGHA